MFGDYVPNNGEIMEIVIVVLFDHHTMCENDLKCVMYKHNIIFYILRIYIILKNDTTLIQWPNAKTNIIT